MVLRKFNFIAAPNKDVLICYFQDDLRLLIRAQMDKQSRNLDNWDEAIEKAIDA